MKIGSDDESDVNTNDSLSNNNLEDYIDFLVKRQQDHRIQPMPMAEDHNHRSELDSNHLLTQLAQKENDLILAAELGKALLERNEELSRANERITEEYSQKLEQLEQEKHGLRRKLDSLEGDFDSRIVELQSDLDRARRELTDHQLMLKQTEIDKARIVQEMVEQNHRLTKELKQASESESTLESQLQSLKQQFNARRTNINDHFDQLEGLREEIDLLSRRKSEFERRIANLTKEREDLNMTLEETTDRISMMEKQNLEQDRLIRSQQKDLDELRHANSQLQNKIDSMINRRNSEMTNGIGNHHSLFNEIEMSSQSSTDDDLRSLNGNGFGTGSGSGDDDIDCCLDDHESSFISTQSDSWKLRQELVEIYQQLRRLCQDLQRRKDNASNGQLNSAQDSGVPATPEELHANQIRSGMLRSVVKQLKSLLQDSENGEMPCLSCQNIASERSELEKLRKESQEQCETIKRKVDEIAGLTTRMTIQETELKATREERDQLKNDMNNCSNTMAKEEIVKRAWEVRDQAVARKNAVEIELAKTRIEVMHINSQLMEAIQQKIELSQQLEQWQVDMQILLDEQLKSKLTKQENEEKRKNANNNVASDNNNGPGVTITSLSRKSQKLLRLWR